MWPEDTTKAVLGQIYNDYYAQNFISEKYNPRDYPDKIALRIKLEQITRLRKLAMPEQIANAIKKSKEEKEKYFASYTPEKMFKASLKYFVPKGQYDATKFVEHIENKKKNEEEKNLKKEEEDEKEEKKDDNDDEKKDE